MSKHPSEMSVKEREKEVAALIAVAIMRRRATPSKKNLGNQRLIPLDSSREGSVYEPVAKPLPAFDMISHDFYTITCCYL